MTVDSADAVRAMAFNIWRSGTLDGAPGGAENLKQLIGFLRAQAPDILFMVETYGSGGTITSGLNEAHPDHSRPYTGVQLTPLGKEWPFYSDHGAVVTDLRFT